MIETRRFTKVQELVYEMKVGDAMCRDVITVLPGMMMSELGEVLRKNHISGTPVVDNDKILGIVSIEDLIKWMAKREIDCPVQDKMTTKVDVLYTDDPLTHAVNKLEKTGFGRFPVVGRKTERPEGVITKGDIIEKLLHKLEIDYHEEEVRRYRPSNIFEDIVADQTTLAFQSYVKGKDFDQAGHVSIGVKKTLERLGVHPHIVRRAAIASYEAEMNLVIYTEGGQMLTEVCSDKVTICVKDGGPGIPDVEKALELGYSTAPDWVRELGFGAGMGLNNIRKCADGMNLVSKVGEGTNLEITINMVDQ